MRPVLLLVTLSLALTGCKKKPDDADEDGVPDLDDCAPEDADYAAASEWQNDKDGDGFGVLVVQCLPPDNPVTQSGDCDDGNEGRYPGAEEICNDMDDDCDGEPDDNAVDAKRWSRDKDDDDYGSVSGAITACDGPFGYTSVTGDCNDNDANIHPGMDEVCDGVDENCDGAIDNDPLGAPRWYRDADADGYGTETDGVNECSKPGGYVAADGDCDDADALLNPGMTEYCNTFDDDCDGLLDRDDPSNAGDGTWFADADGDGWGTPDSTVLSCEWPDGFSRYDSDCDDSTDAVSPDAIEVCLDGLDNDCDGAALGCGDATEQNLVDGEVASWLGAEAGTGLSIGRSLSQIGDWNGDGAPEIVIGANAAGGGFGAVYLVNGGVTGGTVTDGITLTSTVGSLGYAVAPLGDANGDAIPDLVVTENGTAYVLWGPVEASSDVYSAADGALFGQAGMGESVESAGDQDGDGLPDVIVGGSGVNEGAGGVWIVSGASAGDTDVESTAIASISGATGLEALGWSVSSGDMDGDGQADVVTGGPADGYGTGAAWLFRGPLEGSVTTSEGTPIYSEQTGSAATSTLELRGDYNGDGYADLAAGAYAYDDVTADSGRVYVVFGPLPTDEIALADADAFFDGQLGAMCGYSMSTVGSPNGDGVDDLAIGCVLGWDPATQKGYASLVYGGFTAGTYPIASTGRRFAGSVDFETVGGSVGPAGDQDLDGVDDLLVGSTYAMGVADYAGKVSIILGASGF